MISAWPPKYLEQECITRSAPNSKGLCNNNKRKYVSILICSSVLIHKVSQCPRTTCDFGTKKNLDMYIEDTTNFVFTLHNKTWRSC